MMKKMLKNIWFIFGFVFIFLLLVTSIAYPFLIEPNLKPPPEMMYKDGSLEAIPPYPPSATYLFGVDRFGGDIFWMVIDGAKYTILIAIFVGVLRILFGVAGGLLYAFYEKQLRWIVEPFSRAFRFIPAVLIAMLFFYGGGLANAGFWLTIKQSIILALIAFIPLTTLIGAEVQHFLKSEFVQSSQVLGGSKWWVLRKHILLFLRPRLFILLIQQITQALLLMIHLGAFHFIIGGLKIVKMGGMDGPVREVASSLSNEWTGLIGLSYHELMLDKWIIIGPSIGFVLTMLAFNLILHGMKQVVEERPAYEKQEVLADGINQHPQTPAFVLVKPTVEEGKA